MQKALDKLGLRRDIDLALHLPLRYEDETRITRLADAREGEHIQIEGTVVDCEVTLRPRRQLLVRVVDPLSGQATAIHSSIAGVIYARHNLRWATTGMELCRVAGKTPIRSGNLLSP